MRKALGLAIGLMGVPPAWGQSPTVPAPAPVTVEQVGQEWIAAVDARSAQQDASIRYLQDKLTLFQQQAAETAKWWAEYVAGLSVSK